MDCLEYGIDYPGSDLSDALTDVYDQWSCQSACQAHPDCECFSSYPERGLCWLKRAEAMAGAQPSSVSGLVSGTKYCGEQICSGIQWNFDLAKSGSFDQEKVYKVEAFY